MIQYFLRRIFLVIPVVIGISLLVFFLIHLIPGDPAVLILGESAQAADLANLRHELGLDKPLHVQLLDYVSGLVKLDLGNSLHRRKSVTSILMDRFPATIELTLISLFVAIIISFPLGIISAVRARSFIDSGSMFFALIGVSMPNFWLGPLLILLFSVKLDILPVSGKGGWDSYILPAITLGTALAAILTRMIRSSLLEILPQPYISTARAKGLSNWTVILKHALRNALIPVLTIIGLQFGSLLGGSIITETIFSWPGIGRELIDAINGRDYPVIQGCVLVIALCYVVINLITDLLYGLLDPRIQLSQSIRTSSFGKMNWDSFRKKQRIVNFVVLFVGLIIALSCCHVIPWDLMAQAVLHNVKPVLSLFLKWFPIAAVPIALVLWYRKGSRSWKRFTRRQTGMFGLTVMYLFLLIGATGSYLAPIDPYHQDLGRRLEGPGAEHVLGTDEMGRDLFSRLLEGTEVSAKVAIIVTIVSILMGTIIGLIAGFAGGWIDESVMRVVDILLAFPGILLAIALVAVLGPDINNVILALCLMGWVGYARLARAQVLYTREADYIAAAVSLGSGFRRIIFQHLLPNITAPIIVQGTLGFAGVIIAEAGLSFLGLGSQPPAPSWGGILNSGVDYFREGPHMTLFPGLAIMIVVMGFNFFGDALRDALDPKSKPD